MHDIIRKSRDSYISSDHLEIYNGQPMLLTSVRAIADILATEFFSEAPYPCARATLAKSILDKYLFERLNPLEQAKSTSQDSWNAFHIGMKAWGREKSLTNGEILIDIDRIKILREASLKYNDEYSLDILLAANFAINKNPSCDQMAAAKSEKAISDEKLRILKGNSGDLPFTKILSLQKYPNSLIMLLVDEKERFHKIASVGIDLETIQTIDISPGLKYLINDFLLPSKGAVNVTKPDTNRTSWPDR